MKTAKSKAVRMANESLQEMLRRIAPYLPKPPRRERLKPAKWEVVSEGTFPAMPLPKKGRASQKLAHNEDSQWKTSTILDRSSIMVSMNQLAKEERVMAALVEGDSIGATVRMTSIAKNAVAKLLRDIGKACEHHRTRSWWTCLTNGSKSMGFGRSATPNKRTSPRSTKANLDMVTFGRGWRWT